MEKMPAMKESLNIIAAVAENGAIGKDNSLLWHLREDMRYFRRVTLGHPVIMGRKTFESIGSRPLPGRMNVVISRNPSLLLPQGVARAESLQDAIVRFGAEETFIIGGGQIYREAMPLAGRLLITRVLLSPEGADTFFPSIDSRHWSLVSKSDIMKDEDSGIRFRFEEYRCKTVL